MRLEIHLICGRQSLGCIKFIWTASHCLCQKIQWQTPAITHSPACLHSQGIYKKMVCSVVCSHPKCAAVVWKQWLWSFYNTFYPSLGFRGHILFEQFQMQPHLLKCLQRKKVQQFPHKIKRSIQFQLRSHLILSVCGSRTPLHMLDARVLRRHDGNVKMVPPEVYGTYKDTRWRWSMLLQTMCSLPCCTSYYRSI